MAPRGTKCIGTRAISDLDSLQEELCVLHNVFFKNGNNPWEVQWAL